MEEFLKELGIRLLGHTTEDGTYVIDLENSNEYAKIYSKLDKSELVDEDPESSQVNVENSTIIFNGDDYTLTLIADFEGNTYKLTIKNN